ncbi:MAG: hypothetical protein Q7S55_01055 [Nanoarchaeota archaeon]|nr:hypothetical protein [Nanoarchaeota archaeon]
MEIQEGQINTERWWYNRSSRLYFLSTENDPCQEYRGTLVAGDFVRSSFLQVRNGVPFKSGLQEVIYFSFSNIREDLSIENETVMFDPLTGVYQIDAQKWKHTEKGMRFQDLEDSVAPHILHHKERLYTAPTMRSEELDPLFNILGELQKARKERNRGMWWL